jgi:hypothetical protein
VTAADEFEELPAHEPAWAVLDKITAYRKRLLAAGRTTMTRKPFEQWSTNRRPGRGYCEPKDPVRKCE